LSGLHGSCFSNDGSSFDFTTMQRALFVPGFQNNQLPSSFGWLIWSRWMQRLRHVTNICCIGRSEEIWPIQATVGARVDGACPKPWELRIPRKTFQGLTNGIMWKQHKIWEVNGDIKYTYCMWVLVLRDSSAAPEQWEYFVLENTLQRKFLATVLHN
jgi:hypothetical protein